MKIISVKKFIATTLGIFVLSLIFLQTAFAGGSGIQLTTKLSPSTHTAYRGMRSNILDFNVHIEPWFVPQAKIKDITVTCFGEKILSRASLMSNTGRLLGSGTFKSGSFDGGEAGPMFWAKIKPIGKTRVNSDGTTKSFTIAITPSFNAPLQSVECGVSHISFLDPITDTNIAEASILRDDYLNNESSFVTQRASILATPLKYIRIQGK